jgi:hypothetical protein
MVVKDLKQSFNKSKLNCQRGLDKGFGFAKLNIVNPTALSVRRDGGLIFHE